MRRSPAAHGVLEALAGIVDSTTTPAGQRSGTSFSEVMTQKFKTTGHPQRRGIAEHCEKHLPEPDTAPARVAGFNENPGILNAPKTQSQIISEKTQQLTP